MSKYLIDNEEYSFEEIKNEIMEDIEENLLAYLDDKLIGTDEEEVVLSDEVILFDDIQVKSKGCD